ncbi:multiple sugar transport system substrate-binding protein [Stella humosa]|uniref:Multiple sugar transport system substrate-binding protein n=1 Tax=Stella humosa TaxID=94 RepID=A0A3N1KX28_9PROT|nr:extracellular solute-binding protein [Stella humosa]ROP83160.1 multiple sugar transport system substrate-binding protein [Stella humosa]BBK30063.1 ABC transporter substrate-binding protein [Stella humosa]
MTTKAASSKSVFGRRTALGMLGGAAAAAAFAGTSRTALSANASIDVVHFFSGADHPMELVIRAFNQKNTGVTAVSRQEGTTYEAITQKAMAGIAAGRPPAVLTTGWKLASFAKHTLGALDIRKVGAAGDAILANYSDAAVKMVTVEGAVLGIPWALSTPVLYINMDLWRAAGLDPAKLPTTVEELYPNLAQLQQKTGKAALVYEVNEWLPQAFIQNAGGDVLDAQGRPVMDSAEAIYGMEKFVEPHRKGLWKPISISEMITAFQSGALCTMVTSSARLSGVKAQTSFEIKLTKTPGLEGRPRRMNSGGNFLSVLARNSEQQAASLEFLKFCGTAEAMELWLKTGYLNTTKHQLAVPAGHEAAYAQLADGLTPETVWPGARGLEALKAHSDWISRVVNGQASVADGMKGSKAAVSRLLA